ncbi:hypothetical protein [Algoriphagus sp. Y33]|uniref:hypothetical protein n=1 Tax=Algoriphagus sp. Y33 TaxID=2772483 RepID=UPI00177ADC67|nr:hypothetical protein [Algoriphagus sp. Y33]
MREDNTTGKLPDVSQLVDGRIKRGADSLQVISEQLSRKSKILLLTLFMLVATATWLLLAFSGGSRRLLPEAGNIQRPLIPDIREQVAQPDSTAVLDTINNYKK